MLTSRIGAAWSIAVIVLSGSPASAEGPAARLSWDQHAPNLATAQGYQYTLVIDGGPATVLSEVKCVGSTSPFTCAAALPKLEQGVHSLVLTASVLEGGSPLKSPASAPLVTVTLNGIILACSPSPPSIVDGSITSRSGFERADK